MKRRDRRVQVLAAALAAIALAVAGYTLTRPDEPGATPERQAEIAAKGGRVMPFDLERTTHRFAKSGTGGVQTVTADEPSDAGQVKLIREHLAAEAAAFRSGDYGDPAAIHGGEMPGLRALEQGHARIDVRYAETSAGGSITYTTSDAALIEALHAWFDAQVSDHGRHAEHG
ncbi:aspartate carbamoyltransferase [Nonomuraea sp. NN258]|uniref:aspartate carbamoyltransferase n=1 Tax=Nonomuraea antri TaxID=2730852 RepID=UPI001569BA51|nr:aspartate carbamoyltransferase [Nonomuraea antri]NRQ39902.1 aspartate carbamoyltransferase [Nonomuraea antri]